MIDQFINFVIRPPRASYNPDQYLWEKDFTLAGRKYKREDLELTNERGHTLKCSHYIPSQFPDDSPLPCVIYCHGNSGCRADANEAAAVLLPTNITVFTLDFSGSGLSDGDYVSLGWHEKNDLKVVISYLRNHNKISRVGLWGRSMGAVTSLLYGAEDPSIAGVVLDSAFSNLFHLMLELADVYKIRLPKFTAAPNTFVPALFGHAKDDKFIQPQHSDAIFKLYAGDKNIVKFEGDHNSSRPQFFHDSVSIFFYNVLCPPQPPSLYTTKIDKYFDLGDMKAGSGIEEGILYDLIAGLRNVSADASSSAPCSISAAKSVGELISDIVPVCNEALDIEDAELHGSDTSLLQEKRSGENEERCSYTSSNRESWGRCSSLGSDDAPSAECISTSHCNQMTIKVLATPLRACQEGHLNSTKDGDNRKEKKKTPSSVKKFKREKFEKLEALSQRLRLCILKRVNHRRHRST